MKDITVVIPAYNEEKTIGTVIKQLRLYGIKKIIVVDDCSTDKTPKILENYSIHMLRNLENKGHANSIILGLWSAVKSNTEYILYMDADDQIKIDSLIDYSYYQITSGYRVHRKDKFFRKVISFILRMVILIRHGYWIRDANCPFKLFIKKDLEQLLEQLPEPCYLPTVDLEILARRMKFTILQYPVEHYPYIEKRKGSLQSINKKSIKIFWNAFMEVIRL